MLLAAGAVYVGSSGQTIESSNQGILGALAESGESGHVSDGWIIPVVAVLEKMFKRKVRLRITAFRSLKRKKIDCVDF